MKYHDLEMSDFYAELWGKRKMLLAEAIGLDFHMWKAKEDKPEPLPYAGPSIFGCEDSIKAHYSELVKRVYWDRKPTPRYRVCNVGTTSSFAELYGDCIEDSRKNTTVWELAKRLSVSPRHVTRILSGLRREGIIPPTWFDGQKWRPPLDEAEAAIRSAARRKHAPHTRAVADEHLGYVTSCRREADRLGCELAEVEKAIEICERWHRLTRRVLPKNTSGLAREIHNHRELQRAYECMERVARKWRWSFCNLLVALYEAIRNGSKTPVADAKASLGLNHIAFYRNFRTSEIREALRIAASALVEPDWLGYGSQVGSGDSDDGTEAAFSDWTSKVPETDLWTDTH